MSALISPCIFSFAGPDHKKICAVLAFLALIFCFFLTEPLYAVEPVEIIVSGIADDALKNVKDTLILPVGLVRDGTVDRIWLERYATQADEKIRSALEPFGYYTPLVTVTIEAAKERFRLLVKVDPGEPVRLTKVTVTLKGPGREEKRLLRLVAKFPLNKGDVLLQQRYEEAKAALKTRARELGYLDADFSRHEIRIAEPPSTASIELVLATGEIYFFGATTFQGAPEYPDSFLGRHLTYKPGEPFSYPRLGETQQNFTNSERFKEVVITPDKEAADAFRVPVTVHLKAGPRFSLRPGIGYGTDTGGRFTVRYRDLNMLRLGHELYSNLYLAERLKGLVTGYIIPSPMDVRSSTTLQLNLQQEDTATYFSRIAALELGRHRSFGPGKLGTLYLRTQYEDYTVGVEKSTARLVLPGLRFVANHFDNLVRPRRGFRYAFDLRGTAQALGSDTRLVQFLAEGGHLLPLPWRLSLHTRAKAGATMLSDPLSDIPPSLRFFAGGDQSVRGYAYRSLGPRDLFGHVVGGKQLLTGSIELERALFKNWGFSLFYDAGNSFNSLAAVTIYQGAGIGLHYYSSVGALNLSLARPLGADNPALRIHFTVGFEF